MKQVILVRRFDPMNGDWTTVAKAESYDLQISRRTYKALREEFINVEDPDDHVYTLSLDSVPEDTNLTSG